MKYIRKEIIRGIETLADRNINIGNNLDVTGNITSSNLDVTGNITGTNLGLSGNVTGNLNIDGNLSVTGTGIPTKSSLGLEYSDSNFEDVSTVDTYVTRHNLSSTYYQYKFYIAGVQVGIQTTGIGDAPTTANTTLTYNGVNYSPVNGNTNGIVSYSDPGTAETFRLYKWNHTQGDILEFDQTTQKFKPKSYNTLWDNKFASASVVTSVNGSSGAVTTDNGPVKQMEKYFYSQAATGITTGAYYSIPAYYLIGSAMSGVTFTKQESTSKVYMISEATVTVTPANGNGKHIGSISFDQAYNLSYSNGAGSLNFGPVGSIASPTHNVLTDCADSTGTVIARGGHFIHFFQLDTGGQYPAGAQWSQLKLKLDLRPYSTWGSGTNTGVSAALTVVSTIIES